MQIYLKKVNDRLLVSVLLPFILFRGKKTDVVAFHKK